MTTAQIATGKVAVGQLDFENVVPARLALVTRPHSRGARLTVDGDGVVNNSAIRITRIRLVARDSRGFHKHAVTVVDVIQVAPERPVLDSPSHTEVGSRATRCPDDPAAASHEVTWRRRWRRRT